MGDARNGGREPVDGGDGVEALEEEAPPLERDREGAQQVFHGEVLLPRERAQPGGGDVKPPRGGNAVGPVGNGGDEPRILQSVEPPVDSVPRPAGDRDQFQAIEEGHVGQPAQQVAGASGQPHASFSFSGGGASAPPPVLLRRLRCLRRSGAAGGEFSGPGAGSASVPLARASSPSW